MTHLQLVASRFFRRDKMASKANWKTNSKVSGAADEIMRRTGCNLEDVTSHQVAKKLGLKKANGLMVQNLNAYKAQVQANASKAVVALPQSVEISVDAQLDEQRKQQGTVIKQQLTAVLTEMQNTMNRTNAANVRAADNARNELADVADLLVEAEEVSNELEIKVASLEAKLKEAELLAESRQGTIEVLKQILQSKTQDHETDVSDGAASFAIEKAPSQPLQTKTPLPSENIQAAAPTSTTASSRHETTAIPVREPAKPHDPSAADRPPLTPATAEDSRPSENNLQHDAEKT